MNSILWEGGTPDLEQSGYSHEVSNKSRAYQSLPTAAAIKANMLEVASSLGQFTFAGDMESMSQMMQAFRDMFTTVYFLW